MNVHHSHCQHYACRRTDVAPVFYGIVLGQTVIRLMCPDHFSTVPASPAGTATRRASLPGSPIAPEGPCVSGPGGLDVPNLPPSDECVHALRGTAFGGGTSFTTEGS